MKYNKLLSLRKGYHPVFDIENEKKNDWKRFIPNDNFYDVLTSTLNSLQPSSGQQRKKSIWIRGTYGTGKSHATSVIKHLLWDDNKEINDFIDDLDTQYKNQVSSFRKKNKVFPVIIKGASNIVDNRSFSMTVQKAVSSALTENGIKITTKNDFDKTIKFIENSQEHFDWDIFIKNNKKLKAYVKSRKDILKKLSRGNIEILQMVEQSINDDGMHLLVPNITDWLKDVIMELQDQKIADYLMIYWDEFTNILDLEQKGVSTSEWQNIAELSRSNNVYLFLVTHRFPAHYREEDQKKTLDRFNSVEYVMEPLTTYHIIEGLIKKDNKTEWKKLKKDHFESNLELVSLVKTLTDNEGAKITNKMINLFPLHPYSSYLLTFISRYVGSTQRSVFEFLYDEKYGFIDFIENNPKRKSGFFMTPERLWEFFIDEFEGGKSQGMVAPILDKYKSHILKINEKGPEYRNVFNCILLLNILKEKIDIQEDTADKVSPSEENIKNLYLGTKYYEKVDSILKYLNNNSIIQKNPFGVFEISASNIDSKKIDMEKDQIRKNFDLLKVFNSHQKDSFEGIYIDNLLRECDIEIFCADTPEAQLNNKLHRTFQETLHYVQIALFIGRDKSDLVKIQTQIKKFSSDDDFSEVVFILSDESLDKIEFDRYLQYKATANVAGKNNYMEDKRINDELASKIIDTWIDNIRGRYSTWYFRGKAKKILSIDITKTINNNFSGTVFQYGIEHTPAKQPATIWNSQKSPKAIETMLNANTRNDLDSASNQYARLKDILKDSNSEWIIDNKLKIKKSADASHPIVRAHNEIQRAIDNIPKHHFHLGNILAFLSKPPFGYYKNLVNQAALGFLMHSYVNCLYDKMGNPIDKPLMRDKILEMFEFWDSGREKGSSLDVRFGTDEELKLIEKLKDTFDLDKEVKSLNEGKWKVRDKVKESEYPFWVYKQFTDNEKIHKIVDRISLFIRSTSEEIDEISTNELLDDLELNQIDIMALISKKNKPEKGFKKWLSQIDGFDDVNIKDTDTFSDIMKYVRGELQEEVPYWEVLKVEATVLRWKIKGQDDGSGSNGGTSGESSQSGSSDYTPPSSKSVQTTLDIFGKKAKRDDWRELLEHVIKEKPEVWEVIKKYIGG